ncbi:MAG TPA: type II toxin-antitoxin system RelE/ParE family toxin [Flavobacteriaceae bacterium]|nr:type II toxin-antitoxin system RelE/ParE family toxin [Flavobacteriaceae bacterium]
MKYILSNAAESDLESIWLYTFQNWSVKQADEYLNLVFSQIKVISKNPTVGKDYSKIRKGYFRFKIGSHYIFYKINQKNKIVEIIRVLHERMDIQARLNE